MYLKRKKKCSNRASKQRKSSYFWVSSVANSYIHPNLALQFLHITSRTIWRPVNITRSWTLLKVRLTTRLNRYARPKRTDNICISAILFYILRTCSSRESCAKQFAFVRQVGFARNARVQFCTIEVVQEYLSHCYSITLEWYSFVQSDDHYSISPKLLKLQQNKSTT